MKTFLHETAAALYEQYGEEISSLHIVLPSRRARLFFNDALAKIAGKPLWQPRYRSLDELMEELAGLRASDSVRLVAELYGVYSRYHSEPFDKFYRWGETLLADFDQIDKYRIDAPTLFLNLADLKNLEADLSYLTAEQVAVIRRFWHHFEAESGDSEEKRRFTRLWNTLLPIYDGFRARLEQIGLAYPGMIYRAAAERLKRGGAPTEFLARRYALVGFNALSGSEKILFDALARRGNARFFWDYDTYYTDREEQEAGLFLRENILRYPMDRPAEKPSHFAAPKEIVAVAAPSDAMQAKYVAEFLNGLPAPDKETAIVLTDENLLSPVLWSIPGSVEKINVTMGYPLRASSAYTLVERLIELQQHKKTRGAHTVFYHADVTGLLHQPYIQRLAGKEADRHAADILEKRQIHVPEKRFAGDPFLSSVFRPATGREALCEYLTGILARLAETADDEPSPEFFTLIIDRVYQLQNTLRECDPGITDGVLLSLLRRMLQPVRVPYEGEPLEGVQVMGILETRNLDFENVLILSVGDDTFPGNLSGTTSFIPHNLRLAYGLPTPQHHEGVYGYYFYRLIQRAGRVHLVYSVKTDEKKSGEPSRYIYQLDYESDHPVVHRKMALDIQFPPRPALTVPKDAAASARLDEYLAGGTRRVSPSLLYSYVECPLKFYYQAVARLREEEELDEEVDGALFGTIFHKAAEILYEPLKGMPDADARLREMINTPEMDRAVDAAVIAGYFKDDPRVAPADFGGNLTLVADIVRRYLRACLLPFDGGRGPFTVVGTEDRSVGMELAVGDRKVRLGGTIDRLDRLDDATLRVVDYKTGRPRGEFRGVDALFSPVHAERNPAVLQTLFYAWMLYRTTGEEVVPALYYIRSLNRPDYSPLPVEVETDGNGRRIGSREVLRVSDPAPELEARILEKLSEIYDPSVPFTPCEDLKTCEYCPYKVICGR